MLNDDDVLQTINKIQHGEKELISQVLEKYKPVMYSIFKKYKGVLLKNNLNFEDFKQELNLYCVKSIYEFPSNHDNFKAFTYSYLNNESLKYLRDNSNPISKCDHSKGYYDVYSLNSIIKNSDDKIEMIDTIVDEKTLNIENDIIYNLEKRKAHETIRKILSLFLPESDIDFLFDVYGFYRNYSIKEICEKYSITLHDFIKYERLCILILKTSEKIYEYYDLLMNVSSQSYHYTNARFRYTSYSSTEICAFKSIYIGQKIQSLMQRSHSMRLLHENITSKTKNSKLVRIRIK